MKKFTSLVYGLKNLSWKKKLILLIAAGIVAALIYYFGFLTKKQTVTYTTEAVTKGSLITSISGSGTITSVNSTNISSKVSGVVEAVYVSNGDTVTKGQKIALVTLDDYGLERQTSAWKSYLDAQEAVKTAETNKSAADIAMWSAREAILNAEEAIEDKNEDPTNPATKEEYTLSERTIIDKNLEKARLSFTEAETKYNNANSEISAARAQVVSSLRDYQRNSAIIVAPVAGVVNNLNLAAGMAITSSSNSSTNSSANENSVAATATQTFGKISDPKGSLLATVSLSEIDVINVKANQKVTLVFDAYDGKSFTGKVLAVDTEGTSSSGVTTYPVTIVLDPVDVEIYSNMAVTADIITDIQNDVLMVPTTAIQTVNNQASVEVRKNGVVSSVTVEVGKANDSHTIIVSGLAEGDEVVTASTVTSKTKSSSSSTTTSPFSGMSSSTKSGGGMSGPPGGF